MPSGLGSLTSAAAATTTFRLDGRRRRRGEIAVLGPSTTTFKHRPDNYDHYDYRREASESPDQKLKTAIIKFGKVVRVAVPQV